MYFTKSYFAAFAPNNLLRCSSYIRPVPLNNCSLATLLGVTGKYYGICMDLILLNHPSTRTHVAPRMRHSQLSTVVNFRLD